MLFQHFQETSISIFFQNHVFLGPYISSNSSWSRCTYSVTIFISQSCRMPFYCLALIWNTLHQPGKRLWHLNWPFQEEMCSGSWDCQTPRWLKVPTLLVCKCLFVWLGSTSENNMCHIRSESLESILDTLDICQMKAASFTIAKQRFELVDWKHCSGSNAQNQNQNKQTNKKAHWKLKDVW